MESRSRALDKRAAREAQLDRTEAVQRAKGEREGDEEMIDVFELPTAEEREAEKQNGGPHLAEVQRRMQECVRVLGDFKALASDGRYVIR
jgi:ribosomal RNA methyltransferase Nop2